MAELIGQVPGLTIITASCGSGKSHLIKYLLYAKSIQRQFDYCFVFTNTTEDYEFVDPTHVILPLSSDFVEEKLINILRIQKLNGGATGTGNRCILIFDDCLGSIRFDSKVFTILNTQYRHFNVGLIYSTQYPNKLPPTIRECAYSAVIFKQHTLRSINANYESFGQRFFNTLKEFKSYIDSNTDNYSFVLVNNRASTNQFADCYKVLKAPAKIPHFYLNFN